MQKPTRRIIFISIIVIFVVITPWLVLRAQGIRFDFNQGKFVKTGGIFVNTLNHKVSFYLDGKFKKTTNIISNSFFIKYLLPNKYKIEIKKPGYFSWQKTLEVREGLVTEAKDIVLFKKNPKFQQVGEDVEDFLISEDNREILIEKDSQKPEFSLFNLLTNQEEKILSENEFGEEIDLKLLEWDSRRKQILFQEKNLEPFRFVIVDYSLFPQIQITRFSLEKEIKKITLNPIDQDEVIFLQGTNLFRKNFKEGTEKTLLFPDVIWFNAQEENLFLLTTPGFLMKTDISGKEKEILNKTPLPLRNKGVFEIKIFLQNIFLRSGENLYRLNPVGEFEKIYSPVAGFAISPDGEKLVFWGGGEIWLFRGGRIISQGNLIFLSRFSETPDGLSWLNPNYLIFHIGGKIKITETDNRDFLNMITIKKIKKPKIIFNENLGKLYILSEKILFSSEKLLP